jgi:CHAT domain-containing protein
VHPDTLVAHIIPGGTRETLHALVKRINPLLTFELKRPKNQNIENALLLHLDHDAAVEFQQKLFTPFLLGRHPDKLIILPDEILCALPLGAILAEADRDTIAGANGSMKATRIQIALDLEDIIPLENSGPVRGLVMANGQPYISPDSSEILQGLKLAVDEANDVSWRLPFGSTEVFSNGEATKKRFLAIARNYGLLHLAMHARQSGWAPEYSKLLFGTADGNSEPLFGYEILRDTLQARLVVLSACNTAIGQFRSGLGMLSFVHSFVDARVPAVVASLWQVEEGATRELMDEFYKHLAAGKTYSAALMLAKQHLIESEEYKDPFYWAGFMLYGKDGTLNLAPSRLPRLLSYAAFVLILGVALVYFVLSQRLIKLRR